MEKDIFGKIVDAVYIDRPQEGIKTDFGKALLIGGSKAYPGAMALAASFASLSGCGYVGLAIPDTIYDATFSRIPSTVINECIANDEESFQTSWQLVERLSGYSAILFGNGIKNSAGNRKFLQDLLCAYQGILVIDATGLRMLADDNSRMLRERNNKIQIVLTPHLGEAQALFGIGDLGTDPANYENDAVEYARQYDVRILLKSHRSILVSKESIHLADQVPTAALGKAGSGDALAGYMTGLLSYAAPALGIDRTILFADSMIHQAARKASEGLSSGLASILSVPQAITAIIHERMKKRGL